MHKPEASFVYKNHRLVLSSSPKEFALSDLAKNATQPFYVYNLDHILSRFAFLKNQFAAAPHKIHYAMKANANPKILQALRDAGAGIDSVSIGEIEQALQAGFAARDIIFSGVGKTKEEIKRAGHHKIKQINIESLPELERIISISEQEGFKVDVGIRLNPEVNPVTHPYITTGFRENKFGIDATVLPELLKLLSRPGCPVRLRGLSIHIGSQLLDLAAFQEALQIARDQFLDLIKKGFEVDRLDVGGGIGIHYDRSDEAEELTLLKDYARRVLEETKSLGCEILIEPGRTLVARAGALIGEVQYIKRTAHKSFVILNTGMHHLMRPALYKAKHRILPLVQKDGAPESFDIVGPICESSDFLGHNISLVSPQEGDHLAILDAGAYGFSMASQYNAHRLPDEYVFSKGSF